MSRVGGDAALKGPLRRPSAALDRCSLMALVPSPVRHHGDSCLSPEEPCSDSSRGRIQNYAARRSSPPLPTDLPGLRLSLDCDPCAETEEDASAGSPTSRGGKPSRSISGH